MNLIELPLAGAYLVRMDQIKDERGFFSRLFCEKAFRSYGLKTTWRQVNNSLSEKRATLRGLHYQRPPMQECKLVRCIRGAVWDVMVDLRHGSQTYGQWYGAELSADNRLMMYVPDCFAHGYLSLADNAEIIYASSQFYSPAHEGTLNGADPVLGIEWPIKPLIMSAKDANAPLLNAIEPLMT